MKKKQIFDNDRRIEEKRKEIAEIANLKLNIKKILLSLQNKKKLIIRMNEEISITQKQNETLLIQKEKLTQQLKLEKEKARILKSQEIHGDDYKSVIQLMIKNDKVDTKTQTRENYEQSQKETKLLYEQYQERMRFCQHLRYTIEQLEKRENYISNSLVKPIG